MNNKVIFSVFFQLIICAYTHAQSYIVYSDSTHKAGFYVMNKKISGSYTYKQALRIVDSIGNGWHLPTAQQATDLSLQMFGAYDKVEKGAFAHQIKNIDKKVSLKDGRCPDCAPIDPADYWTSTFAPELRPRFKVAKDSIPCPANYKSNTQFTVTLPSSISSTDEYGELHHIFLVKEF